MKSALSITAALAAMFIVLTVVAPAFAHSKMFETIPANMTSVGEDLDTLVLKFDRKVRLTVIEMMVNEQAVEVEFPRGFVTEADVTFENLGVGCYDWNWIAVAQDGHTMEGTGHFEITATPEEHTCEFEDHAMENMDE